MVWPIAIACGWHPVAMLRNVTAHKPHPARLLGRNLVLFRSGERVAVFKDRCPHRGVPLSRGVVRDGTIACPYHGWRFGPDGHCVDVPGARACPEVSASTVAVKIAAGLVWVSLADNPLAFPVLPDAMDNTALDRFWWELAPSDAGLLDALENHLDPAHPHHVHPWLVRSPHRRKLVEVDVRCGPWGAEAIYVEQRRNVALLSGVLEGRRARSIGRLWPPSIGEVRLESERGGMLSISVVFAPEDEGRTRPWAHFATPKGYLPAWLKRDVLKAFHWPVLQQDRRMLRLQQEARTGEPYRTGPLDVLSHAIWAHANRSECTDESHSTQMYL
jgi:phenylpropionate dioxygenase-like ring-hydroxylating dioxygenase large terminal subunit